MKQIKCPEHKKIMKSKFSVSADCDRYYCDVDGCEWYCWDGPFSSPTTPKLAKLRQITYDKFNCIYWNTNRSTYYYTKRYKQENKDKAYVWLQKTMNVPKEKAHVGLFDEKQCKQLLKKLETIKSIEDVERELSGDKAER